VYVCVWEREKKKERGGYFQQYLGSNRNLEISKNVRFTWLSVSFRRLLKNKWEGLDHIFGGKKCVMMISTKCFKFVFGQMRYFWRDSLEECAFYHNKFDKYISKLFLFDSNCPNHKLPPSKQNQLKQLIQILLLPLN